MVELVKGEDRIVRCGWSCATDQYRRYHDEEWGFPVGDDRRLFEKFCLEGFQSGLSWRTILEKRENFRAAFRDFGFNQVAKFAQEDVERLLQDAGIIRHRGKIEATINNAQRAIEMVADEGSLARFFWRYEPAERLWDGKEMPGSTEASAALSKELKKRGWKFVGPTTAYAFMQAMGLVNDHPPGCDVRDKVEEARRQFTVP
ncbi:MAG: DNA-3-methyladenine glycosylase I [Pseudomonadota bacterium]